MPDRTPGYSAEPSPAFDEAALSERSKADLVRLVLWLEAERDDLTARVEDLGKVVRSVRRRVGLPEGTNDDWGTAELVDKRIDYLEAELALALSNLDDADAAARDRSRQFADLEAELELWKSGDRLASYWVEHIAALRAELEASFRELEAERDDRG